MYHYQLSRVKVALKPHQLVPSFERQLESNLKQTYGNKTHLTGYIIKNSIEIIKIETGHNYGASLTGDVTFWVTFKALYLQPTPDVQLKVRVNSVSKIGVEAIYYPMTVIVPKFQVTDNNKTMSDLNLQMSQLLPGDYIIVKIIDYSIRQGQLMAVAHYVSKAQADQHHFLTLHSRQLLQANMAWQPLFRLADNPPEVVEELGDNQPLVAIKAQITPYAGRDPNTGQLRLWDALIKYVINPYELVDIYRPAELVKYKPSVVRYMSPQQVKRAIIWSKSALYPVFSRAYFKLYEIIIDYHLLDSWKNRPITVACLAEGPGGFLQSIIDARNYQHGKLWTKDTIHAITLKRAGPQSPILDWSYPKTQQYFQIVQQVGIKMNLSYGKDSGDLLDRIQLQAFIDEVLVTPTDKAQLVTADGGIELKDDQEYSLQELFNAKLFYAETLGALALLGPGGHFVIKIYDIFYQLTADMILLLSYYFDTVTIHKPHTSRPANSEKYLVCQDFNGISDDRLRDLWSIYDKWNQTEPLIRYTENNQFVQQWIFLAESPDSTFKQDVATYNNTFVANQINKINEGITLINNAKSRSPDKLNQYYRSQVSTAIKWCKKYGLPYQQDRPRVIPKIQPRPRK